MGKAIVIKGANYSGLNLGKITLPYNESYTDEAITYLNEISEPADSDKGKSINTAINALMDNGIWDKIHSAYPFVGNTADKANVNLKNPTQLASLSNSDITEGGVFLDNATNRILLNNNIPVTSTGHVLAYNKTLEKTNGISVILSSKSNQALTGVALCRDLNGSSVGSSYINSTNVFSLINEIGSFAATFEGTINKVFSKGILKNQSEKTITSNTTEELYLGSNNGVDKYFTACVISYVSIGQGLTDDEILIYNNIIEELVSVIH